MDARALVEDIRKQVESASGTRIWSDFTNALNLISEVVFTRSSGFILELIQNAEDAGLGLPEPGVFRLQLNNERVIVQHNGAPFSDDDVAAISGIRSSKKPERGTLGYLGIGFKSVFKVTDCPRVYSGDFRFKFDRAAWPDATDTPWRVMPLWIEDPDDPFDAALTTFDIPLRDDHLYSGLRNEIRSIRTELFLFLKWLKTIEITDEPSGEVRTLRNLGENDGMTTLSQDGREQRFKFFRRTVTVPDWVREDRLTQQYRVNVTQREIAIAFALDGAGNLAPSQAGAMYGGVYSFIPLGEATSGAKFPMQADFLVQPGRDAINYEAPWNHWLLGEVADLCIEAVQHFKADPRWKFQFLPAFDFTRNEGQDSYEKLFGPKLLQPVEEFLNTDPCVPTNEGGWTYLSQAIRLDEDEKPRDELVKSGILSLEEVSPVLGGQQGLTLIDPRVEEGHSRKIRTVDRRDLLRNGEFLRSKAGDPDGAGWFKALYRWLADNPVRIVTQYGTDYRVGDQTYRSKWLPQDGRTYRANPELYHGYEFVLAADKQLHRGGLVNIPDLRFNEPFFEELANALQKTTPILHPTILGAATNDERTIIRRLLTAYAGVQTLDAKKVCKEAALPRIATSAPKRAAADLLRLTNLCIQNLQAWELPQDTELWVLAKRTGVRRAKEVVFGVDYLTGQDWECNRRYVPGAAFLSGQYLPKSAPPAAVEKLRDFFKRGGVKEAPDNGVEDFGVNFTMEQLKTPGIGGVTRVEKRNFGYDLRARHKDGTRMLIEVKGQTHDQDVELDGNEAASADKYKGEFYLAVVPGIPNSPALYVLNNPAEVGKKDKLLVPIAIWRGRKWR